MVEQQVEQSYNTQTSYNQGYNIASALQIRLDTSKILEDIELYLSGKQTVVEQDPDTGKIKIRKLPTGTPKANSSGIQSILNYVSGIVNPQVVQGNFPSDGKGRCEMYDDYILEVNIDLVSNLIQGCYKYGIKEEDIEEICDFIMKLIQPFMTRLIDNKERDSYASTLKHIESNVMKEGKEGLKLFSN